MITPAAKIFLSITALAGVAAVVYGTITADHFGTTLLLSLGTAAFVGAVSVTFDRQNEFAPVAVDDEAPAPPELRPAPPSRLPGGPGWPALAALAIGFVVVGFVLGGGWAVPGLALAVVAGVGWLASASSDRTGRVANLMPIGIPVAGLFAIGALMFFMSRILLAVPEAASTTIAMVVAAIILAAASVIALKPQISKRTVMASLVVGGLLMVGGGIVAAAVGGRHIEEHHSGPEPVELAAIDIKFNLAEFNLVANSQAEIDFDNGEAIPHNVAIYDNPDFRGRATFQGAVVVGPESIVYKFRAPGAGTYYFRCDIHPAMQGKVLVA